MGSAGLCLGAVIRSHDQEPKQRRDPHSVNKIPSLAFRQILVVGCDGRFDGRSFIFGLIFGLIFDLIFHGRSEAADAISGEENALAKVRTVEK